ncbi:unnamed protein product, partial [Didymodactylos carnosus]
SWCASGNCLSLHHEYDKAIQAFKRAIQIAPESDYAYTLLGNEYAVIDELERALACFRKAIQLNGRSYKAWNGVALVYLRQEKFPNADFHFSKAANIFRTNPDLICHWAIAQHKCHRSESALSLLNEALKIDPKNALCKFHKAGLLLHLERYHEALSELEELRQIAPKESLVYYLLSKVHRHLKNFHYSYMYMSWSMDLDPKGANNQLKENADKLYSKDEDLLLGMEEMASSITEDDMSQMASQSSLQDMQPMDSSVYVKSAHVQFRISKVPRFFTPINDNLFLAGSFNNWKPNDEQYRLIKNENQPLVYSLNVSLPLGSYQYKITRGTWEKGETLADGSQKSNRYLQVNNNMDVNISVDNWSDNIGKRTASNQVFILESSFSMFPFFNRTRRIWIYLPRDYFQNIVKSYPVIYAHDGQNLFDQLYSYSGEWGIDETLDNLFQTTSSVGKGVIVVGIDNGGSERLNELTPFSNSQYGGGQADKYLEFIIQKLKPYIDTHFRTKSEREHTVILGSSLGGLVSFYAAARYSHIFGRVGVFSPSFWFSDEIYRYASAMFTLSDINPKLYFVCGGKESASTIPDMEKMIQLLIDNKKYTIDKNIKSVIKNDGEHSEWFWKREFVDAIQWLFNN